MLSSDKKPEPAYAVGFVLFLPLLVAVALLSVVSVRAEADARFRDGCCAGGAGRWSRWRCCPVLSTPSTLALAHCGAVGASVGGGGDVAAVSGAEVAGLRGGPCSCCRC